MSTSQETGANIRAELARRGMSQRELAVALGVSTTGVHKRLTGVTPIDVNELALIARLLDVDPATLMRVAS